MTVGALEGSGLPTTLFKIITTGSFTPDAGKEATRDGAPAIDLVVGDTLCQLLRDQALGVRVRQVEEITVDDSFFDGIQGFPTACRSCQTGSRVPLSPRSFSSPALSETSSGIIQAAKFTE